MNWEPWTGCYAVSTGCKNCFYYGPRAKWHGQNTITKTDKFDWPIRQKKNGEYNIKGDKILATCFATDFFVPEADQWREEAWQMIKARPDIDFLILTKRIDNFAAGLPADWGEGYENVNIGCSVENQQMADQRLPIFLSLPIKRRFVACSPLLEAINLTPYLDGIKHVSVGGETSRDARLCDYDWVLDLRRQSLAAGATFWFKNTGSVFKQGEEVSKVNPFKQTTLAKEFGINHLDGKKLF